MESQRSATPMDAHTIAPKSERPGLPRRPATVPGPAANIAPAESKDYFLLRVSTDPRSLFDDEINDLTSKLDSASSLGSPRRPLGSHESAPSYEPFDENAAFSGAARGMDPGKNLMGKAVRRKGSMDLSPNAKTFAEVIEERLRKTGGDRQEEKAGEESGKIERAELETQVLETRHHSGSGGPHLG